MARHFKFKEMKHIPQRTYTRNGTIFKTCDGVRRKFGKVMILEFKASTDVDSEIIQSEAIYLVNEQLKKLNICDEIQYIHTGGATVGIKGRDFIENLCTIQIKFERVKP